MRVIECVHHRSLPTMNIEAESNLRNIILRVATSLRFCVTAVWRRMPKTVMPVEILSKIWEMKTRLFQVFYMQQHGRQYNATNPERLQKGFYSASRIPRNGCGFNEIEKFQKYFLQFSIAIVVFDKKTFGNVEPPFFDGRAYVEQESDTEVQGVIKAGLRWICPIYSIIFISYKK